MTNEKRLEIEKRIIRKYIKAIIDAGYTCEVSCEGETLHDNTLTDVTEIVDHVTSVDDAHVVVRSNDKRNSFLYFVMGNEPGEVLADYGVSLEEAIAPVNKYAEQYA